MSNKSSRPAPRDLRDFVAPTLNTKDDVEQITLFTIDGTDYKIPLKVRANLTLKVIDAYAERGEAGANKFLLTELLGEDGYDALVDFDGEMTEEDFDQVLEIAQRVALGKSLEEAVQGKRR